VATSLTNFFGGPFFGGEFFFGGGPAPAVVVTRAGAPVWWLREQWRRQDQEKLEELQEECAELEEIIEEPIIYAPRKDPLAAFKEARLQQALESIRIVQDRIKELQRKKQEVEDYNDFLSLMRVIDG